MRSIAALDVRRRFGEIVDQAAAGERFIIERAGQPVAAIVPLADLALVDPERRQADRLKAIDEIAKMARRRRLLVDQDPAAMIGRMRRERDEQIARAARSSEQ